MDLMPKSLAGKFKVINTPFKFSRTRYRVEQVSPNLGEHTQEILTNLLGIPQEESDSLRKLPVI